MVISGLLEQASAGPCSHCALRTLAGACCIKIVARGTLQAVILSEAARLARNASRIGAAVRIGRR
jgi:hypothetical protein